MILFSGLVGYGMFSGMGEKLIMDWQHYFAGAWLFPIKMKLPLACVLLVLLFISIILGQKFGVESKSTLTLYTLSFLTVVFIGFFGGQLVYSG
jgi:hypothetical protein